MADTTNRFLAQLWALSYPPRQVQNTGHRSQVIVLLTQKVSQTPLKANLRPKVSF